MSDNPIVNSLRNRLAAVTAERDELRGTLSRLCRAVRHRMSPDEPTPEDRMEFRLAYDEGVNLIEKGNNEMKVDK